MLPRPDDLQRQRAGSPVAGERPRIGPWEALGLVAWSAVVVTALSLLMQYESTAGASGRPPEDWPSDVPLERTTAGNTVLLFAHPRCPCTRASLNELAVILAARSPADRFHVVLLAPSGEDGSWRSGDIVRRAAGLSGAAVAWDADGRMAERFRVRTSGHVLVYDRRGMLTFEGGITGLRGHEGWNAGRESVLALSRGGEPRVHSTPVFGCPLQSDLASVGGTGPSCCSSAAGDGIRRCCIDAGSEGIEQEGIEEEDVEEEGVGRQGMGSGEEVTSESTPPASTTPASTTPEATAEPGPEGRP